MDPSTEFLDTAALAEWLGLHPQLPVQWRYQGDGPPFVKIGRSVRYRVADVESWLAERTVNP